MSVAETARTKDPTSCRRSRFHGLIDAGWHWAVLGLLVLTFGGFLGRLGWLFDLSSHFRLQYLVLAALLAGVGLYVRKWPATAAFAVCLLANLAVILPYYRGPTPPPPWEPVYRALLFNIACDNTSYGEVRELLRAVRPDFFVICELTPSWERELEPLREYYPHAALRPAPKDDDGFGIGIYSRIPMRDAQIQQLDGIGWPSAVATLSLAEGPLKLIGTHAPPPSNPRDASKRNAQMLAVAQRAASSGGHVLLLGDLNCTSWSPAFADLLHEGKLRDSRYGFGLQPSWPTMNPLLRITIDHCLVSPQIVVHKRWIGPDLGSDHFPVIVEFSLRSPFDDIVDRGGFRVQ